MASVSYLEHSGFAVRTPEHLLVFDYLGRGLSAPPEGDAPALFFVSHAHGDHYWPGVAALAQERRAPLVLGEDLPPSLPGVRLAPGEAATLGGAQVRAYGSTDQGVSFLVRSGGLRVFHAGDLNLWHWQEESTEEVVAQAEAAFEAALDPLEGQAIDLAFFPVDARLGAGHDRGALRFAGRLRPRILVPMHWWGDGRVARAFAGQPMPSSVRALALTQPGVWTPLDLSSSIS